MELELEKEETIIVARQLGYPKETIVALKKAKSIFELDKVMTNTRHDLDYYRREK